MPRTWAVVKREFSESIHSRMFIIGTLFGPLFMVAMIAFQAFMMRTGGGEKAVVIADGTGVPLGARVAEALQRKQPGEDEREHTRFFVQVVQLTPADSASLHQTLLARIEAKDIDGIVWLTPGVLRGQPAVYEGRSATNVAVTVQLRAAIQSAVQSLRLAEEGIDPTRLAVALRPVELRTRKAATGAAEGSGEALLVLGYAMGLGIYFVVMIFGMAVMRGVLEEKKDRIVEVVVSSIRANDLMLGKVLGIGGASLLQVSVWAGFVALGLHFGRGVLAHMGVGGVVLPHVPGSVGVIFLSYFAGGFMLYAAFYATLGAMAASDQDMQQLQLPATMLLVISFLVMFRAMMDPEGGISRATSWIPFSSPMVMPVRAALSAVPLWEVAGSLATLLLSALVIVWIGGKIYRIGILATGKKPSMAEIARWVRTA